jgi:hypothetical protein
MKTVIATIALSLVSAVSLAKSLDSTVGSRLPAYIDGSAYEQASNTFVSQKSRADVAAEAKAAPKLPAYVDGSEYEKAMAMFMSQRSRAEVRAEAASFNRLHAGLLDLHGGRNSSAAPPADQRA